MNMPTELGYYHCNLSPLINAEVTRLRAKGCTKSAPNLRALAERNVRRKHP